VLRTWCNLAPRAGRAAVGKPPAGLG